MSVQPGPDATDDLRAQMNAVTTANQVETHPAWGSIASDMPVPPGSIEAVLEGPEGQAGVVQEANEAAEDAAMLAAMRPQLAKVSAGYDEATPPPTPPPTRPQPPRFGTPNP